MIMIFGFARVRKGKPHNFLQEHVIIVSLRTSIANKFIIFTVCKHCECLFEARLWEIQLPCSWPRHTPHVDLEEPPWWSSTPVFARVVFLQKNLHWCIRRSSQTNIFLCIFWEKAHILEVVFKEKNKTPDLAFIRKLGVILKGYGKYVGIWRPFLGMLIYFTNFSKFVAPCFCLWVWSKLKPGKRQKLCIAPHPDWPTLALPFVFYFDISFAVFWICRLVPSEWLFSHLICSSLKQFCNNFAVNRDHSQHHQANAGNPLPI